MLKTIKGRMRLSWGVGMASMLALAGLNVTLLRMVAEAGGGAEADRILAMATTISIGIGVATGEMCQNRIVFKQLLASGAIDFCQYDSCRVASINELLGIMLMAEEVGVPCCPHAGGVGLVQVKEGAIFI